ncbi:MAG: Gfo/Idh/MocA family oxidoreductase [Balneolaceae bacterium]
MKKINWGILSTAKIGREHVIPAIQQSQNGTVAAIASRNTDRANNTAQALGIPVAHGTYGELFTDNSIDAIYNPLPNHLHVSWTLKALEAGKHVLCEKPLGLDSDEVAVLLEESLKYPNLKVMEAFMYRFHPQWIRAKELVQNGSIGELKTIHSVFSYFNRDETNIRNKPNIGGGALMDIGCYCISTARFLTGSEPESVSGMMDLDPDFGIDRKTSGMLNFGEVSATFTCSTQMTPYQRLVAFGTEGRIEIEIPFNAPADKPVHIHLITEEEEQILKIQAANQYTLQAEAFADAIMNDDEVPTPLPDAVNNMKVIDAIVKSSETGSVVSVK